MKYQDIFPEQSKLEEEVIRSSSWVPDVISSVLNDAYQRGVLAGMDAVIDDPQAYDLVSSDRGGN